MNGQKWDRDLYHQFIEYFLYKPTSIAVGQQLYRSRAQSTWRIYLRAAIRLWSQARIAEVNLFPLSGEKLLAVMGSVPRGRWRALHWTQVRAYLKVVCSLNNEDLDQRVLHMIDGQARQNIVPLSKKTPRPVFSPIQMRSLFFKIKALKKTHAQQRGLMALMFSYYAVGRGFDLSYLQGKHLELGENSIQVNYHIRKNNKLALKRHVAKIYSNYGYLCPVATILQALVYMRIGPEDFLFHKDNNKSERMEPASIIAGVKALQRQAGSQPALTLTDVRSSATSALVSGGVPAFLVMMWGNWDSNMISSYARSNDGLKKSLQRYLDS